MDEELFQVHCDAAFIAAVIGLSGIDSLKSEHEGFRGAGRFCVLIIIYYDVLFISLSMKAPILCAVCFLFSPVVQVKVCFLICCGAVFIALSAKASIVCIYAWFSSASQSV